MTGRAYEEFNRRGLILGPGESEEAFLGRVQESVGSDVVVEAFDLAPDWVEVEYSNQGLAPWHGAMTWIDGHSVRLQLRRGFLKGHYLFYARDEVIAHELAHVGRMAFNEPCFEEVIAYRTSSGLRRFLGPVFVRRWEVWLLLVSLIWWPLGLCVVGLGLGRLVRKQWIFSKCLRRLGKIFSKPLAVAYRLSDREIMDFAKWDEGRVRAFIDRQDEMRWQMIRSAYNPSSHLSSN